MKNQKVSGWCIAGMVLVAMAMGAYAQQTGELRAFINPEAARELGARWRIVGSDTWNESGHTLTNVPTGNRVVEFMPLTGWYQLLNRTVNILNNSLRTVTVVYTPKPVPGPDFVGCGDLPYAPLPQFNLLQQGGAVTSWPTGQYDFCAYMDSIYCSLQAIAYLNDSILEFAELVQCRYADLNGPMVAEEIPFTPNGILDGQYELGIVAVILNDVDHPLHDNVRAAFEHNFYEAKEMIIAALSDVPPIGPVEGDIRPLVNSVAPHLSPALASVLAGYGVFDDALTLEMLDELLNSLDLLGFEPPEGGIQTVVEGVSAVGQGGDANNDGFTNQQAHDWYVGVLGYTPWDYTSAAVDPEQSLLDHISATLLTVSGGDSYLVGNDIMLEAVISDAYGVISVAPFDFTWMHNGVVLSEASEQTLLIEDAHESDSGVYGVTLSTELTIMEGNVITLSAETALSVEPPLPVGGGLLASILVATLMVSGGIVGRRRLSRMKKEGNNTCA